MSNPKSETSTEMAVVPNLNANLDSYRRGLEPMTIEAAFRVAEVIALTKMCGITSAADALARIMAGRELGLSAMQSIRGVFIIENRPALDASLLQALVMQHPDCEQFTFIESTTETATLLVKRRNRPEQKVTWTIKDAQRAKLIKAGGAWEKTPAHMLRARCKADAARLEFPDVIFGLYSREELMDDQPPPPAQVEVSSIASAQTLATDYDRAERVFLDRIATVANDAQRAELRTDIHKAQKSGELPEPWIGRVIAGYTEKFPPKAKRQGAAAPQSAAPPPAAAAPPPVPPSAQDSSEQAYERQPGEEG